MMDTTWIVTWEVEDGYAGKSRPQKTKFNPLHFVDSIEEWNKLTDEEKKDFIGEAVQEDFEQKIMFGISDYGI